MPFELRGDKVILCEGLADKTFLRKFVELHALGTFDFPFPQDEIREGERRLAGKDAFGAMLNALQGDRHSFKRIPRILIIADSGEKPKDTFDAITKKVRDETEFEPPDTLDTLKHQSNGFPQLSISLIPKGEPGALETLCAKAICNKHDWIEACVVAYLSCGQNKAMSWSVEKRDKARIQCMVAALHEKDPNKTLSYVFSIDPPIIPLSDECFGGVRSQIEEFCR
jgi:hypothetical protein